MKYFASLIKHLILAAISLLLVLVACNSNSRDLDSIVGVWNEYRDDPNDDYGLGTYKFNDDGTGYFMVKGYTSRQKRGFVWEKQGDKIIVDPNSTNPTILELNNGLLIEDSNLFGTIVYRKK